MTNLPVYWHQMDTDGTIVAVADPQHIVGIPGGIAKLDDVGDVVNADGSKAVVGPAGPTGAAGPTGPAGPGGSDADVAGYIDDSSSVTATSLNATFARGISIAGPSDTGDDTATFRAAVVAAAGGDITVAAGTYTLDGLSIDGPTSFKLDANATLLHKANSVGGVMFSVTGNPGRLRVRGGMIDGNKDNQTVRTNIFAGILGSGALWKFNDVDFVNSYQAAFYVQTFGGVLRIEHCTFAGQAYQPGTGNNLTAILSMTDGEPGAVGLVAYNHNWAIADTATPAIAGSNPGGLFLCSSVNNGDSGNLSTLEATGNHFYGYGQNCASNDISAFHFYPEWLGARITNNYFEECSYAGITAKCVTDFVCTGNVFKGGVVSAQNFASEGVIGYVPGYHAASIQKPRAVIANNIIDNTGGQSSSLLCSGIVIKGTETSYGTDIVVANNVVYNTGAAISVVDVEDISITGNILRPGTGSGAGTQSGITFNWCYGKAHIANNTIDTLNGYGIQAINIVNTARFTLDGNTFDHDSTGYTGVMIRGAAFVKMTGNTINATAGVALNLQADASGNKIGQLAFDASNTINGTVTIDYAGGITSATGQLADSGSPVGVVTPGEVGTTYRQTDGTGDGIMWTATGTTSGSWVKALGGNVAGVNNFIGWAYDPINAVISNAIAAAGVLYVIKVPLPTGGTPAYVWYQVASAGDTLTAGECFVGIYNSSGTLLATSTSRATDWTTAGNKQTPVTVSDPQAGDVYVAFLWNGTTGPGLRGVSGNGMGTIGLPAATTRFATAGSGLTALPATLPTLVADTKAPWCGVA